MYPIRFERFPEKFCEKKKERETEATIRHDIEPIITREGVRGQLAVPLPFLSERKQQNWRGGRTVWTRALTAIIIIFTRPRVIKAACYTCSVGGY